MNNFASVLRKNFGLVIALMIVCALGLGAEKYFTVETKSQLGGDAFVQCLTRLDTPADNRIMLEPRPFFVTSPMELYIFLDAASQNFDFGKFNANWSELSKLEQIFWINTHLSVERFEHNIYIFSFRVGADEPHDYNYLADSMPRLLDDYVAFAQIECSKVGIGELVPIERAQLLPQATVLTRRSIVFKYMIIGAILGLIAGLIVIFGLSVRRAGNG